MSTNHFEIVPYQNSWAYVKSAEQGAARVAIACPFKAEHLDQPAHFRNCDSHWNAWRLMLRRRKSWKVANRNMAGLC